MNTPLVDRSFSASAPKMTVTNSPLHLPNYYRLVQVDKDGSVAELGIRLLNSQLAENPYLYPNPAKDKIYLSGKAKGNYMLYNNLGQKLRIGSANELYTGVEVSDLSPGIYYLSVEGKSYKLLKK